jgi:hypothetical protein
MLAKHKVGSSTLLTRSILFLPLSQGQTIQHLHRVCGWVVLVQTNGQPVSLIGVSSNQVLVEKNYAGMLFCYVLS